MGGGVKVIFTSEIWLFLLFFASFFEPAFTGVYRRGVLNLTSVSEVCGGCFTSEGLVRQFVWYRRIFFRSAGGAAISCTIVPAFWVVRGAGVVLSLGAGVCLVWSGRVGSGLGGLARLGNFRSVYAVHKRALTLRDITLLLL